MNGTFFLRVLSDNFITGDVTIFHNILIIACKIVSAHHLLHHFPRTDSYVVYQLMVSYISNIMTKFKAQIHKNSQVTQVVWTDA